MSDGVVLRPAATCSLPLPGSACLSVSVSLSPCLSLLPISLSPCLCLLPPVSLSPCLPSPFLYLPSSISSIVLGQSLFSSLESERSASMRPSFWHFAQ